ncbi:tRNA-uridine aminocarboxypropyltransferase [Alteromonadaceae bacterium BrNp21-10]|nr:tRNA-uridine aminocarboxypropyltransferase [Alteromonadaceae bacterium BrNp21-10]
MSKRLYCPQCQFPLKVCLCESIIPIDNSTRLIVLQHPSEVRMAKNTVRLLQLSLARVDVFSGESAKDFASLQTLFQHSITNTAVLYPHEQSLPLEQHASIHNINTLIVIDGTWRKAYKIWQLNPWLWSLPSFHFEQAPNSNYQRVAKQPNSLSTLEATAYALSLIEQRNFQGLNQLQQARQQKGF